MLDSLEGMPTCLHDDTVHAPLLGLHSVRVTNQGDKDIHLPKILKLSEQVANAFVGEKSELRSENELAPPVQAR